MTRRTLPLAVGVAALGVLAMTACSQLGTKTTEAQPSAAASSAAAAPKTSGSAKTSAKASGKASAKSTGIPDICKLLTKSEVTTLTGEQTTLMSDDGDPNGATRYCQWQLSQGQLTITVSPEDRAGFDVRNKQSVPVAGVGTAAYSLAGHLYVWQNGRTVDVYVSSESTDASNIAVAKRTATQVLPRIEAATK